MRSSAIQQYLIKREWFIVRGERLKEVRKGRKITQDEVAQMLGTKKSAISLYENNKIEPGDKSKVIVAKYFNVSLDYLLGIIDTPVPFFDENRMVLLPENITEDERKFVTEYLSFIATRQKSE